MPADDRLDILLVEDNRYDEKLTLRALRRGDVNPTIEVARDGAEALQAIAHSRLPPRLVLLDIKLPKVDGLEVLRRIREDPRTARQPVVMLTSSRERSDIDAAYARGANSYVVKPTDSQQFAGAIGELGQYWLALNEPPNPSAPRDPEEGG